MSSDDQFTDEPKDLLEYLNGQLNISDDDEADDNKAASDADVDVSMMQVMVNDNNVNIADLVRRAGISTRKSTSDQERVEAIIEDRRAWLKEQNTADDIRRELYDKIVNQRKLNGPLNSDVEALRDTNTRLYDYIGRLERINASIYCPKCHKVGDYSGATQMTQPVATTVELVSTDNENVHSVKVSDA
ncbi:hypothetical protein F-LCD7_0077 [Faustovirus]|nr:hypothetical protein F-LCD7_0077 [Faustovirus]